MILRPAIWSDWPMLLAWRNDEQTRANSRTATPVTVPAHLSWLSGVLNDASRELLIAEDRCPVGTIRADTDEDGITELSWTIAPNQRVRGFGQQMLNTFVASWQGGPLVASIKEGNQASVKMALKAGFVQTANDNGMLKFHKETLANAA